MAIPRPIGVGIIGASPGRSWAAVAHIPALHALPDFALRAISTTRRETADAAAAASGAALAFDNHEALVASPQVDLVVVAVKVPRHFELVSAAIAAGKAVYCEWPLGNGLDEAIELARLARAKGVLGVTGLQSRSAPAIAYLRDLVRDGYVGDVLSTTLIGPGHGWAGVVDAANAYTLDAANGATMLTIPFGHSVDALTWVLGEFATLDATLCYRRTDARIVETGQTVPMTAADQIVVGGTLENGAAVAVQYRAGMPRGTKLLWEINGTAGDLRVTAEGGHLGMVDIAISGGRGEDGGLAPLVIPAPYLAAAAGLPEGLPRNVALTYAKLASDLRHGTRLSASFDDAVIRHRMIDAIESSARRPRTPGYVQ